MQLIYEKLPKDISERHVLLLDPVLATGNCFSVRFKVSCAFRLTIQDIIKITIQWFCHFLFCWTPKHVGSVSLTWCICSDLFSLLFMGFFNVPHYSGLSSELLSILFGNYWLQFTLISFPWNNFTMGWSIFVPSGSEYLYSCAGLLLTVFLIIFANFHL